MTKKDLALQPTPEQKQAIRRSTIRLTIGLMIGFILFMIPTIWDTYTKMQQGPMVQLYQNQQEDLSKKYPAIKKYNKKVWDNQKNGTTTDTVDIKAIMKVTKNPLGLITIPSIDVENQIIYYGTSDETLSKGLGYMPWTSLPAGGKNTMSAITGHTGMANKIFFDNIKFLEKGDAIYLSTLGQKMKYEVTSKKKILPTGKGALENFYVKPGKDMIVLMTCTPTFINSHRLLVYAKRVPIKQKTGTVVKRGTWRLTHIWMAIVLILMALFVASYLHQRYRYHQIVKFNRQDRLNRPQVHKIRGPKKMNEQRHRITEPQKPKRKKSLWWFLIPLLALAVTAVGLLRAQKELTVQQQITYSIPTATKQPPKKQAEINEGDMTTLLKARDQIKQLINYHGIGQLLIPSQTINLPIFNIVTDYTLSAGVAQYYPDRTFLTGNTVLASHNFLEQDLLLYRIKNLKRGDIIYITDYQQVFKYTVTSNQVVDMTKTSVLKDTKHDTLTLLRCEGGYGTRDRLVVKAKLQGTTPLTNAKKAAFNIKDQTKVKPLSFIAQGLSNTYTNRFPDWRLLVLVLANLLVIALVCVIPGKRQRNRN